MVYVIAGRSQDLNVLTHISNAYNLQTLHFF